MKKRLIWPVLLILAVVLCGGFLILSYSKLSVSQDTVEEKLGPGTFDRYDLKHLNAGDSVAVDMKAEGSPVDVLILNRDNYTRYDVAAGNASVPWSACQSWARVTKGSMNYTISESGDYFLVIDNTHLAESGAGSSAEARVAYTVRFTWSPLTALTRFAEYLGKPGE